MSKEIWKDVVGYEGLYQISNHGRVKTMAYIRNNMYGTGSKIKERIKSFKPKKDGYMRAILHKNGKAKTLLVSRMVAMAFLKNPKKHPCVNHIDGNPLNNHVSNLEWCSYSYNMWHKYHVLGWVRVTSTGKNHFASKPVYSIDKDGKKEKFESLKDAERIGVLSGNVARSIREGWKTGGRNWFYDKPYDKSKIKYKAVEFKLTNN